ncbi:MAG: hypothetical protein ABMA64_20550 [Myxococcota bacterium]
MWLGMGVALARAGTSSEVVVARPVAGHPVFELRIGADRVDPTHPFLCAEGSPTAWLSLEACGTGAGILHQDPAPDMAHFRARGRVLGASSGRRSADWWVGAGFTEVQRTTDAPGFDFGRPEPGPSGEAPIEAAGPEVSTGVKGRYWFDPGARAFLSADLHLGAAVIPGAPAVMDSPGPVVPFGAFTVGVGF